MTRTSCPTISYQPETTDSRISGVGDMMIMGGEYGMRVWMESRM